MLIPLEVASTLRAAQVNDLRDAVRATSGKPNYPSLTVRAKSPTQVQNIEIAIKNMGFGTFSLLDATRNAGIQLTDGFAMYPAAAVSGWYFSHPGSQYFVVGRVTREQVEDYAKRKGWTREEAERWLAPNLDYDPE